MSVTTVLLITGILGIFAGIFLSLTAVGVFTNEARGVSKSLAVVEAFTAAPQAMKDELAPELPGPSRRPLHGPLHVAGQAPDALRATASGSCRS